MTLRRSQELAVLVGVVTPVVETFRRWHELAGLTVWWPAYLDDVLLGGFLLFGAWRVGRNASTGRPILSAAWGFMGGIAYSSLAFQLHSLNAPDPSGYSPILVVGIKAIGLALAVAGFLGSLHAALPSAPA